MYFHLYSSFTEPTSNSFISLIISYYLLIYLFNLFNYFIMELSRIELELLTCKVNILPIKL